MGQGPKLRQCLRNLAKRDLNANPFILPLLADRQAARDNSLLEHSRIILLIAPRLPYSPPKQPSWWPNGIEGTAFLIVNVGEPNAKPRLTVEGHGLLLGLRGLSFQREGPLNAYLSTLCSLSAHLRGLCEAGSPLLEGQTPSRAHWKKIFRVLGHVR